MSLKLTILLLLLPDHALSVKSIQGRIRGLAEEVLKVDAVRYGS